MLVGMGDSVTAGFGASPGLSYFDRLVRNPPDEFAAMAGISLSRVFPRLTVTNLAVSGSTSLQHAEKQLLRLRAAGADTRGVVVLTTGGNDLIHDYGRTPPREGAMYGATLAQARPWVEAFERRLEGMIGGLRERFPGGCHIFLANIYDPTDGVGDVGWTGLPPWPEGLAIHRAYNEVLGRCAERHPEVHLVDLRGTFMGHGIHCTQFWRPFYRPEDPHYWYGVNLEDPNDRGYDVVRRAFLNRMVEVFAPSP
jgi:lysophospholipase L1-like esterase